MQNQTQIHAVLPASAMSHYHSVFLQLEEELCVLGTPAVSHSSEWVVGIEEDADGYPVRAVYDAPGRRALTLELDGNLWTVLGGDPRQDVEVCFCGSPDALQASTAEFPELAAAFRRAFSLGGLK